MKHTKLRSRVVAPLAAALAVVALAACGSSGTVISEPSTAATTTVPPGTPVFARDVDNGHTITVHAGAYVQLVLGSTYWQVAGADRVGVLQAVGVASYQRGQCPPGVGCGTTSAKFVAVAPGTVQLRASRLTCGEALMCQAPMRHYAVTVVVTA